MRYVLTRPPRSVPCKVDPDWGVPVYDHSSDDPTKLPSLIRKYLGQPHTLDHWIQQQINGHAPVNASPSRPLTPYPYQDDQTAAIVGAHAQHKPGYLLVLDTGMGKTPVCVQAVNRIRPRTVLVITNKGRISSYQRDLHDWAQGPSQWIVLNPERLIELFPRTADPRQSPYLWGEPILKPDVIIADESHHFVDQDSLRSTVLSLIQQSNPDLFTVYSSATPFSTLRETYYTASLTASVFGISPPESPKDYLRWLSGHGIVPVRDKELSDEERTAVLRTVLYESGVGTSITQPAQVGLPDAEYELVPLHLSSAEAADYDSSWDEFCEKYEFANLTDGEPTVAVARALRSVQKASRLKSPYIAREVVRSVRQGNQVVVAQWFAESVSEIARLIDAQLSLHGDAGRVGVLTGRTPDRKKEDIRKKFQIGQYKVLITSTLESINLHEGEKDVTGDGVNAISKPRVMFVSDPLTGGKRMLQAEGRVHRNKSQGRILFAYAYGTRDQNWYNGQFLATASTLRLSSKNEKIPFELREHHLRCAQTREELADRIGTCD